MKPTGHRALWATLASSLVAFAAIALIVHARQPAPPKATTANVPVVKFRPPATFAATGGPQPSVGLYWVESGDPTTGGGVCAPQWQLLFRTDNSTLYYKSGTACTAWTPFEGAGGGTVTSITCGTDLTCTPSNPITGAGTIAFSGVIPTIAHTSNILAGDGAGNAVSASASSPAACSAGAVVTDAAWSAAGALSLTCTAIGTAGGVTGTGTSGQVAVWNGTTSQTGYTGLTTDSSGNLKSNSLSVNATAASGAGDIEATTETVSTTMNAKGQFQCSTINAQTLSSSPVNNWNPTNLATTCRLDVTASLSNVAITGIAAQPTGTILAIESDCANGANTVQLSNLSGSSSTANQFDLAGTWTLPACNTVTLQYTGANWRPIGWMGTEVPSLQIVGQLSQGGALLFTSPQTSTTTGSQNNVVLNSTTVEYIYNGAGSATFTGMAGGNSGRLLVILNEASSQTLTLSNQNASSTATNRFQNFGGVDVTLVGTPSAAVYIYLGGNYWQMIGLITEQNGQPMTFTNTANRGTVVSGGTATVTAGSICTCADTGAATSCEASLSSTTLTVTGTAAHNYNYLCF